MVGDNEAKRDNGSIYHDVRGRILDGTLTPGSPLVEGSLAAQYHVSRSPVREALSRLLYEGLVERHDRALRVRVLRPEEVLEIYEVRIALEAAAARAAAQRRTDLDLGRLQRTVESMRDLDPADTDRRPKLAHATHFIIWEASHNRALIDTLEGVHRLVIGLASTTLHYPDRWETFLGECVDLLDAIRDQNVEGAGEIAARQMTNARDFRVRLYSANVQEEGVAFL